MITSQCQNQLISGLKHTQSSSHQQIRHFSRRRIAYPFYKAPKQGRQGKYEHKTQLRFQMECFLGKPNYKGEYLDNKYFKPSQNHKPKYILPVRERGNPLIDFETGKVKDHKGNLKDDVIPPTANYHDSLHPFPHNKNCKTNFILSHQDRSYIYQKITKDNVPTQQLAVQMGIKIPRLEAVVKLKEIEERWNKKNLVTQELKNMSNTMYKMFPLFNSNQHAENLTEIPVPERTLTSRFLTVAENEPFGPIEASKIYRLPLATDLLKNLDHDESTPSPKQQHYQKQHEPKILRTKSTKRGRSVFEFKQAKVGQVGFRYGTVLRDNKKDRRVDYDESGKMIYALPESG
ncbi:37S ribosomal protein S35, mitochondrial [Wickerhamomyces ciferrii]|uniref:37S ribosomal protein S35, mitochondrial n=1 Tax=Wickerhamomyces ciferrii (strain ATCC 14091 / BCRC 22168 / CBS 111 / JCM 3599 / NBRC 0793 / NRRL Y-1031 F-60-10) TaxID=1206466 RepID=K0KBD2_WICCF|nr:37S ribosomal protein S35, mitochondrial [Wickerhamomyces ciferrii]CCH42315.1 37S ribosomal protein S35, mitochondrial [Wickerhamomyces ciferrii]